MKKKKHPAKFKKHIYSNILNYFVLIQCFRMDGVLKGSFQNNRI